MYKFVLFLIACFLIAGYGNSFAEPLDVEGEPVQGHPSVGAGGDISAAYLREARDFRDQGRYELARQSYSLALSTCRNNSNLEIIKRELAAVELLIRSMR